MRIISNWYISVICTIIISSMLIISVIQQNINVNFLFYPIILSFVILGVIIILNYADSSFLNNNLIVLFVLLIIFHTLIRFTIFPTILDIEFTSYPLLTAIFLILVLIYFLLSDEKINFKFFVKKRDYFFYAPILLSFFISVALVNYQDLINIEGITKIIIFLLSGFFCGYFIPLKMINEKKIFIFFIYFLFYFGIISSIVGYISIFIPNINLFNENPGYSISFFGHPNAHAFLYSYSIPSCLFLFLENLKTNSFAKKVFFASAFLFMYFNLVFTYNRSGLIAVSIGVSIFIFYYNKKLFLFFLLLLPLVFMYLLGIANQEKGATTIIGRIELLYTSFEMMRNSTEGFLWGFGTFSVTQIFEDTKLSLLFGEIHNNPHNMFVYFILQFGIIPAFFLYTYIFINLVSSFYKFFKKKVTFIHILSISVCSSVLIQGSLEDLTIIPEYYMLHFFMIFIGLIILYNKHENNNFDKTIIN